MNRRQECRARWPTLVCRHAVSRSFRRDPLRRPKAASGGHDAQIRSPADDHGSVQARAPSSAAGTPAATLTTSRLRTRREGKSYRLRSEPNSAVWRRICSVAPARRHSRDAFGAGEHDLEEKLAGGPAADRDRSRAAGGRSAVTRSRQSLTLYVNGKFLTKPTAGVGRVATELLRALDLLLAEEPVEEQERYVVLAPRGAVLPFRPRRLILRPGRLEQPLAWEQIELPVAARRSPLIGLCNMAPLLRRSDLITMVHDANVFIERASNSASFSLWYRFMLPLIGSRSDLVPTVSRFSAQQLAHYEVAKPSRIAVVPNGADHLLRVAPDTRGASALLGNQPFFLGFSSPLRHKRTELLLSLAELDALGGRQLVLIGKPGSHRASPGTTFTGPVTDGLLRALFESAEALLFPSTTEGFGLPPVEAMSLSCPVVASPAGALPEICGNAALYPSGSSASAWADAVDCLLSDEGLRQRLQRRGRVRAQRFTWAAAARMLRSMLLETYGNGPARP